MKLLIAVLIIILVLLVIVLSSRKRTKFLYKKYLTMGNSINLTGKDFALLSLDKLELDHVSLAVTDTELADAYIPKTKTLVMSNAVCNYSSISSLAIVSHELGHALQDKQNNRLFGLSVIFSRILKFTNFFIIPTLIFGLGIYGLASFNIIAANLLGIGINLLYTSLILFILNCTNKLITIPLEYNASKKALIYLKDYQLINKNEIKHVKKLLNAAAQTYISSLFDGIIIFSKKFLGFFAKKPKKDKK